MSAQGQQRTDEFVQMTAAFGRARARMTRSLARLADRHANFVEKHGERASLDDIASVLPSLRERLERLEGKKVTPSVAASAYRIASDVNSAILDKRILEDVAEEASDAPAGEKEAGELLAALQDVSASHDALITACDALDDEFDDETETGEESMASSPNSQGAASRPGGTIRLSGNARSQVKGNTVTSQLISSLDRLGLPHSYGTLELDDDEDGRLTDQLIRALSDRFEIVDTESGTRVRTRQRPVGGFRTPSEALSGRIAVDAQAIAFATDQLAVILDGIENQVRFVERPGIAGGAPRSRRLVDRRLDEIATLAASPQGIPAGQANVKSRQLAREVLEYLAAIGIDVDADVDCMCGEKDEPFDCDDVTIDQGAVVREELRSEVVDAGRVVNSIHRRLQRAACCRSDAEIGYRLERSLERAMFTARATLDQLGSVEMADTLNLWESTDIKVPDSCGSYESLGNGLADAMTWLIDVSQPFVEGDREVEQLGRLAMDGLANELELIATVLRACAGKLSEFDLEGTAEDIAENTSGLAVITAKCAEFAHRLGS